MAKYFLFLFLTTSFLSFSMYRVNRNIDAIDLALIQRVTKKVHTTKRRSREVYCADLSTKQQLIAERITIGSKTQLCCDLVMSNGLFFHAVPIDDSYFALLEAKYHEMH